MVIWKYPIDVIDDYVNIEMQIGARILCVQTQKGVPAIWALVNPDEDTETRRFRLSGTGHPIKELVDEMKYIGTFQLLGGSFVGHLFEIGR